MRIAICGTKCDRSALSELLLDYCVRQELACEIKPFASGEDLLCAAEEGAWYDVIFMEVLAGRFSGLDAAQELRAQHCAGDIILYSTSAECAVAGYDVGACGYLVKPFRKDRIDACMDRLTGRQSGRAYQVRRRRQVVSLPYEDILFVESQNSKCLLHLRKGENCPVYKKLGEIEEELNDARFLRCHQSYLVNLDYVARINRQFELTTGDVVLIRQRSLKTVRQVYLDYMTERAALRRAGLRERLSAQPAEQETTLQH